MSNTKYFEIHIDDFTPKKKAFHVKVINKTLLQYARTDEI